MYSWTTFLRTKRYPPLHNEQLYLVYVMKNSEFINRIICFAVYEKEQKNYGQKEVLSWWTLNSKN